MGEKLYYIEAFSDEVVPCRPTLAGWAEWLAKAAPEWGRPAAAQDGDRFEAYIVRFEADIILRVGDDGAITLSHRPEGVSFLALRYCEGGGWDSDDIIGGDLGDLEDWIGDPDNRERIEDGDRVAAGFSEPNVMLVYHADGPSLTVEALQ